MQIYKTLSNIYKSIMTTLITKRAGWFPLFEIMYLFIKVCMDVIDYPRPSCLYETIFRTPANRFSFYTDIALCTFNYSVEI